MIEKINQVYYNIKIWLPIRNPALYGAIRLYHFGYCSRIPYGSEPTVDMRGNALSVFYIDPELKESI